MPEILVTCALPTYNSADILWLQLESLCRQETSDVWELLLAEEASEHFAGRGAVEPYRTRLEKAGCRRVVHWKLPKRTALVDKWRFLAGESSPTSRVYLLCASDNYSPPSRIADSMLAYRLGYDWYDRDRGHFYDITTGRMALWVRPAPERSGLFMATRTEYVQTLPPSDLTHNIDGFIKGFIRRLLARQPRHFRDVWAGDGLHTDGCNQISHHRAGYYATDEMKGAFHSPHVDSPSALLPPAVATRLEEIHRRRVERAAQSPLNLEPVL